MSFGPKSQAYLDGLPNALRSYPSCQVKSAIVTSNVSPELREPVAERVDPELHPLVRGELPASVWVPEVHLQVINYALLEHLGDEREFLDLVYTANREMFRKPTYRALAVLMTKRMIPRVVAKLWGSFHKGSTLSIAEAESERVVVELRAPRGVFAGLSQRVVAEALCGAADAKGGNRSRVVSVEEREGVTRMLLDWSALD